MDSYFDDLNNYTAPNDNGSITAHNHTIQLFSNSSFNTTFSDYEDSGGLLASGVLYHFFQSLYVAICLVSIIGNFTSYIVLLHRKSRVTESILFMVNLGLSDLLLILLCIPNNFMDQTWYGDVITCTLYNAASEVCFGVSVSTLMVIGVKECFSISSDTHIVTKKLQTIFKIIGIWLVALIQSMTTAFYSKLTKIDCGSFDTCSHVNIEYIMTIVNFMYVFCIPCLVLTMCSFYLQCKLHYLQTPESINEGRSDTISQKKSIKMVLYFILLAIVCYLPYFIHTVIIFLHEILPEYISISRDDIEFIIPITYWFEYAHACLYPVIILTVNRKKRRRSKNSRFCLNSCCYCKKEKRMSTNVGLLV